MWNNSTTHTKRIILKKKEIFKTYFVLVLHSFHQGKVNSRWDWLTILFNWSWWKIGNSSFMHSQTILWLWLFLHCFFLCALPWDIHLEGASDSGNLDHSSSIPSLLGLPSVRGKRRLGEAVNSSKIILFLQNCIQFQNYMRKERRIKKANCFWNFSKLIK